MTFARASRTCVEVMSQSAGAPPASLPVSALRFRDDFVNSLPGDPSSENRSRTVQGACYSRVEPAPAPAARLLALVPEVAQLLDLSTEETPELVEVLAGSRVLPGMVPYAACYGGHQFGQWAGQLGDGRAITLGEVHGRAGRYELQLKGAGRTPYSRHADGKAVLRSSLRELVCSEAMHQLGVPTTRALSLVLTGEKVMRDLLYDGHPEFEPGAVVCRVAPSFLRFGNFEIFASRNDSATLARLVRYTIERFYPQFLEGDGADIGAFFREVVRRTAQLIVEWTRVGFVHGVMNTDNMSILGLTIDYGPYGWLDVFDPDWTPNITDAGGRRYRFGHQPRVAHWNLAMLARALLPFFEDTALLEQALADYPRLYEEGLRRALLAKLGLDAGVASAEDDALLSGLFPTLTVHETDMTLFFRRLSTLPLSAAKSSADARFEYLRDAYYGPEQIAPAARAQLDVWLSQFLERVAAHGVGDAQRRARADAVNPLYLPRNYLVQQVIERSAAGDRSALAELLEVLRRPYQEQPGREAYAEKRPDWARMKPGCSMLSCSS